MFEIDYLIGSERDVLVMSVFEYLPNKCGEFDYGQTFETCIFENLKENSK